MHTCKLGQQEKWYRTVWCYIWQDQIESRPCLTNSAFYFYQFHQNSNDGPFIKLLRQIGKPLSRAGHITPKMGVILWSKYSLSCIVLRGGLSAFNSATTSRCQGGRHNRIVPKKHTFGDYAHHQTAYDRRISAWGKLRYKEVISSQLSIAGFGGEK